MLPIYIYIYIFRRGVQLPHIYTFSQQIYLPKILIHVAHSRFSPQSTVNFIVQVFLFCMKRALKFKFPNSSSKGRNNFVLHSIKHLILVTKTGQLISHRKIIDVCCENRTKHTHTRRQFEGFEDVKNGGTKSIGWALKD